MKFEKSSADWLDLNVIFAKFAIINFVKLCEEFLLYVLCRWPLF